VLTLVKLSELIAEARLLLADLCDGAASKIELEVRCEQALKKSSLQPHSLIAKYLAPFKPQA
jgi:hypothetical protein